MSEPLSTAPALPAREVRTLTADEVTLCHSRAVLAQKHDGTDPSFTTLLSLELQRVFMAVNGLVESGKEPETPPAELALRTCLGDALDAKNTAYRERNMLVAALARLFPSGVRKANTAGDDPFGHDCVFVDLPTGQVSWHFLSSQADLFAGLPAYDKPWDGHDTPEKYRRLAAAVSELQATADTIDAEKWRALIGSARVRVLGHAGCNPDKQTDPSGNSYGDYAHIGLELWTVYNSAKTEPAALAALEGYVAKAVAVRRGAGPRQPTENDVIARCKRVLTLVDDYHDQPTQSTRAALRHHLHEVFEAAVLTEKLLAAPESEAFRLKELLERLRERCAEMAENTVVAEFEGVDCYGDKAAERIRTIELGAAVREFIETSPAAQSTASMEQALGLYANQEQDIRELLDKRAPNVRGSIKTRIAKVLDLAFPQATQENPR